MQLEIVIKLVLIFWSTVLTLISFILWSRVKKLSNGVEGKNLSSIIENVFDTEKKNSAAIRSIVKDVERIEAADRYHFQKIGIVRFNPFNELGGDHSFALALLDNRNNGFVITGLHTRERTRVYLKQIVNGKSEFDLSKEEEKSLVVALKKT